MDNQKHLFNLPDNHHYINCAYLSPLLKSVDRAGRMGIARKNHPWKVTPDHFFQDSNQLRSLFAEIVNAPREDHVAILPAVSYGLATVARNLNTEKGNTIILAGEQFPSNVYIWKRFCKQHNCQLKMVDPPENTRERGKLWNQRLLEAIDDDTLLVALGNIHWTDGTLFDIKAIGDRVQQVDGYFVVDGTQSVGALPVNVQEVSIDALICAGYKWLMGPYSMTLGYFSPRFHTGLPLEEGWIVRKDSEDFSSLIDYQEGYQPGAQRFDVGERSNFILVPMMIAALKQIIAWNPAQIQQYCRNLTEPLVEKLPELGYQVEDPHWRAHHMFGIRLPDKVDSNNLQQTLKERNIHISVRGTAIRIAPNVYNDTNDIQALLDALKVSTQHQDKKG